MLSSGSRTALNHLQEKFSNKMSKPKKKPILDLMRHSYQPKKAEREADMRIRTTPENLARALGRQVIVRESKPKEL